MPKKVSPPAVFVAHSFAPHDATLVKTIKAVIRSAGYSILSGEAPTTATVSEKVRTRIEASRVFVTVLTRRHRVAAALWTTSPWVIEEKAYSFGQDKNRPIILLVENGIGIPSEIGGINGDLEYIVFDRYRVDILRRQLRLLLRSISSADLLQKPKSLARRPTLV